MFKVEGELQEEVQKRRIKEKLSRIKKAREDFGF